MGRTGRLWVVWKLVTMMERWLARVRLGEDGFRGVGFYVKLYNADELGKGCL